MMERTQIFDLMGELKLYGMRSAYDEVMAAGVKRQHEPPQIVGDLLKAEIAEKHARSIKYQMTIAKLPLAKDIDDFDFDGATVNETLARDLSSGGFVAQQRNIVLVGGTGTGKTHLAIAIARSCIRAGLRGRKGQQSSGQTRRRHHGEKSRVLHDNLPFSPGGGSSGQRRGVHGFRGLPC